MQQSLQTQPNSLGMRVVTIHGDIAWEFDEGYSRSRLVYLTGNPQDRFPLPIERFNDNAESVSGLSGVEGLSADDRLQNGRGSIHRVVHHLRDLFLKRHTTPLSNQKRKAEYQQSTNDKL